MGERGELVVVRLGHRPGRDDRITTHVGLTARALGADRFVLVGEHAAPLDRIADVTDRFGGPFETTTQSSFDTFVADWSGKIAHLTMYGLPIQDCRAALTDSLDDRDLAVVVGAGKVPFEVYERADWNVGVTNQPHSEVAGVAIFLRELLGDPALAPCFHGGRHRVEPQARGKSLRPVDDSGE